MKVLPFPSQNGKKFILILFLVVHTDVANCLKLGSAFLFSKAPSSPPPATPPPRATTLFMHLDESARVVKATTSACLFGRVGEQQDACRTNALIAIKNPAIQSGLLFATVLFVAAIWRFAHRLADNVIVFWEIISIQMQHIGRPIREQYHIWSLLLLDSTRRLAKRRDARKGADAPNKGWLPHVDNLVNRARTPNKKKDVGKAMDEQRGIVVKDVVLVGGGHAHAYVIKNFGMNKMEGVQVTLITRDVETPYSGMVPGHIAGLYSREECHIDLGKLCNWAGVRLILAEATGIDTDKRKVLLAGDRPPVSYDVISINIGSSPSFGSMSQACLPSSVTPVKPIDGFSRRWEQILERVTTVAGAGGDAQGIIKLVVVGGGAGGMELALSMQARLKRELSSRGHSTSLVKVSLVAKSLMPSHNKQVRDLFTDVAHKRGLELLIGKAAVSVSEGHVICSDGTSVPYDEIVWCTDASAPRWLKDCTTLDLTDTGFIKVDDTLESVNVPGVFAAGDICHIVNHPRPKAGVFAVRAGPPLARNIRSKIVGGALEHWTPQTSFLGIIGTGETDECVASKAGMGISGAWLWELKDYIDRTWMSGYSELPSMDDEAAASLPALAVAQGDQETLDTLKHKNMRCMGCAAKVPADILSRVMQRLKTMQGDVAGGGQNDNNGVLVGLEQSDDCAVVAPDTRGWASVHTVDFLRSMVDDPYVLGIISANHALSDCYAMGAEPRTALAIAVVPYGLDSKVEEVLLQMMSGATKVLKESRCVLVGGHTCEGPDLSLGFCVNGAVAYPDKVMRKGGVAQGHVLILTKALGTGVVLAAHMRNKARGAWVAACIQSMCESNGPAVRVLVKHGASACTDVTGFGLAGHLAEMLRGSAAAVDLSLEKLPALPGATECLEYGVLSSLDKANRRHSAVIANAQDSSILQHPKYSLLFDPQTSGGLLAAIPPDQAAQCIAELKSQKFRSNSITCGC